jgi:hypothetical protein
LLSTHHAELPHVLDRSTKRFLVKKPTKTGSIDRSIEREREREIGTQTEWRQNHQPHKTKKTKQKKKVFYIIIIIIIIMTRG